MERKEVETIDRHGWKHTESTRLKDRHLERKSVCACCDDTNICSTRADLSSNLYVKLSLAKINRLVMCDPKLRKDKKAKDLRS
ncbi:hypothetical protein RRG08_038505 [Elysia crispata]|uniref:Uncharacterized protein n=1 Tax=Elysia crispata TaxID=231223 RepID=A0AAE1DYJ8_9GAST|nr:hypothetical protein RRG08_038505 [Elysia crispata]